MMRTIKRSLTRSQYFRLFAVLMAACIIPACHRDRRTLHDARPTANDDAVVTVEDVAIAILLTGTDMTFALGATAPANGALSGFDPATGDVTYTPDPGFIGDDTFTFTVTDGTSISTEATVTVSVVIRPTATAQAVETPDDMEVEITLTGTDPDGLDLAFALGMVNPVHGALSTLVGDKVAYTPFNDGFVGDDTFSFTATNGTFTSTEAIVTVTVLVTPETPTAIPQAVETPEDTPIVITLTGTDPDGLDLTFALGTTDPVHGALSTIAGNTVTYTPDDPNFAGDDSFSFTVTNGTNMSAEATVTINLVAATAVETLQIVLDQLQILIDATEPPILELNEAFDAVSDALDLLALDPPDLVSALGKLEDAAKLLESAVDGGLDFDLAEPIFDALNGLARTITDNAIGEAEDNGGSASEIAEAYENLSLGDEQYSLGLGHYGNAINEYREALDDALEALN